MNLRVETVGPAAHRDAVNKFWSLRTVNHSCVDAVNIPLIAFTDLLHCYNLEFYCISCVLPSIRTVALTRARTGGPVDGLRRTETSHSMQIFHRSTNTISRATIYGAVFVVAALFWAAAEIQRSPYVTYAGVRRPQPVPFSHQHHVAGTGHRLPLLPHLGGNFQLRRHSSDQDLHELPFPDLDQRRHAGAGARELPQRASRWCGPGSTICPTSSISTTAFISTRAWAATPATARWTACR